MAHIERTGRPAATFDAKSSSNLGFLTVVRDARHGLFGGYLVLNMAGRPVEFHCSAPIRPNRAQQILYGPTLEPYLFGEQIGKTLVTTGKIKPAVIFTDQEPALAVREFVSVPVVLVLPPDDESPEVEVRPTSDLGFASQTPTETRRLDAAHGDGLTAFRLGRNRLATPDLGVDDRRIATDHLGKLPDSFDLAEPFGRIREAIEEARRGGT
ncbi:MAG: hypothetical protein ABIP48_21970 [Planctomycetota bacterium]